MKRRLTSIILCLCLVLIFSMPFGAGAAQTLCFIATNDYLDPAWFATFEGGAVYVPYGTFSYFGVNSTYFADAATASLSTAAYQIYFDMAAGTAFDSSGTSYEQYAVFRNGQVYVPVAFICNLFGLSYSYVAGQKCGHIMRITDSSSILTDSQFLSAAEDQMLPRYNAIVNPPPPPTYRPPVTPSPSPSPSPSASPSPTPDPDRSGTVVYLSFEGLPTPEILDAMKDNNILSCFFLTGSEIQSSPSTVRALLGARHRIGILAVAELDEEFQEASGFLAEAARTATLLVSSSASERTQIREDAQSSSLVFWDYDIYVAPDEDGVVDASLITAAIDDAGERIDVRLAVGEEVEEALPGILRFLTRYKFTVKSPKEFGN